MSDMMNLRATIRETGSLSLLKYWNVIFPMAKFKNGVLFRIDTICSTLACVYVCMYVQLSTDPFLPIFHTGGFLAKSRELMPKSS